MKRKYFSQVIFSQSIKNKKYKNHKNFKYKKIGLDYFKPERITHSSILYLIPFK